MEEDGRDRNDIGNVFRTLGPLLGSGVQLAASVIIMFFAGRWCDNQFGTAPWLMLAGIIFGVGAGLTSFIRTVNDIGKGKTEGKR